MKNLHKAILLAVPTVLAVLSCNKDSSSLISPKKTVLPSVTDPYYVSTIAGTDDGGFTDGVGENARYYAVRGITADNGYIYNVDQGNNAIRRTTINDGTVITLFGGTPGYADGNKEHAKFSDPIDIAVGPDHNLYVTDYDNFTIREINLTTHQVSTFAGCDSGHVNGPLNISRFGHMAAIGFAKDGTMYVWDDSAHKIRKISPSHIVSDFAGSTFGDLDGPAATAQFSDIEGIAVADDGTVYVADARNHKIKKISTTGIVTTVAGSTQGYQDGPAATAKFKFPYAVAINTDGSLFVDDEGNHRIRLISTTGQVTTVAGTDNQFGDGSQDGPGDTAKLFYPIDIVLYNNALYFTQSNKISKLTLP